MRIGAHVKMADGLVSAVDRAVETGCEAIQIFAANPGAWKSAAIKPEIADEFRRAVVASGVHPVVIHTPYLLNLASPDEGNYTKSAAALADSLLRGDLLGVQYVVTHVGSHKGEGFEASLERIWAAIRGALAEGGGNSMLLLENSSGSGNSVGGRLEEIAAILSGLPDVGSRIGICLDTAHLWGAGYDLSTETAIDDVISKVDAVIGINRLTVIHLNDTLVEMGSRKDRHENIGAGRIGAKGFRILVNHPALSGTTGIVETPYQEGDGRGDVEALKGLRL